MRHLVLVCLAIFASTSSAADLPAKPNIIVILVDDLGYGDLGCFGQKRLKTPNIDRLAKEGMKLNRMYAGCTVCAPSRCVLLSGLHTGHCRIRGNEASLLQPQDRLVGQPLRENGYRTACFGKWGVGSPPPLDDPKRYGFDRFYGYVDTSHAHNFYPDFLVEDGKKVELPNVVGQRKPNGAGVSTTKKVYAPDLIQEKLLQYLDQQVNDPFFIYYAPNMPHTNNEAGQALGNGMELRPNFDPFAATDWPAPEKGFAGMMLILDEYIGQILDKVDEKGLAEKTLILFTSDNGPHQEGGHQSTFFQSSGHLRGIKRDMFEGGLRVPGLMCWKGVIPAGSTSEEILAFQDLFPTLTDLTGSKAPEKTDGISWKPLLQRQPLPVRQVPLYWAFKEQGGKEAVLLDGRWKGIRLNTLKMKANQDWLLFDLQQDPSETTNIAKDHPEIIASIQKAALASKD